MNHHLLAIFLFLASPIGLAQSESPSELAEKYRDYSNKGEKQKIYDLFYIEGADPDLMEAVYIILLGNVEERGVTEIEVELLDQEQLIELASDDWVTNLDRLTHKMTVTYDSGDVARMYVGLVEDLYYISHAKKPNK